jgi:hypothetical protein
LARLCLTFKNNPKMETTAVMLLNSLMEEKEKSSINFKCVSISLLKRCTFSGSEVASLLEPHSNLLLDIIENESDLSLRRLSAEVLPKITSSRGLSQMLNQMKSRILSLGDSEDDLLIRKILSNNLLQLLTQKSQTDSQRLTESIELLLLIQDGIEDKHLFSLINFVCQKSELQDQSIECVLSGLSRGHGMPGFVMVTWYLMGEFGDSVFNSRSSYFPEFLKLINKAVNSPKSLRLIIISALAKLWVKIEHNPNSSPHFETYKSAATRLFRTFIINQDLETQSRASQFLFLLQCPSLSSENKLEIFSNMPCKLPSQQFDLPQNQFDLMPQTSMPEENLIDLNFTNTENTQQPAQPIEDDPLNLFSTPISNTVLPPKTQTIDPGLDLFMNSPMQKKEVPTHTKNVTSDPLGLDLFDNGNGMNGANLTQVPPKVDKGFDDMDLLNLGVDLTNGPVQNKKEKNNNDMGFDLGLL